MDKIQLAMRIIPRFEKNNFYNWAMAMVDAIALKEKSDLTSSGNQCLISQCQYLQTVIIQENCRLSPKRNGSKGTPGSLIL